MSDGDSAGRAERLRDHATFLLQEAARCGDPVRRDGLLREAVARPNEARLLLDGFDAASERLASNHPIEEAH